MKGLLAVLGGQQVIDVSDADLGWIAGIDGATARPRAIQLRGCVVGVDDVLRLESETREIRIEQRCVSIGVQQARNTYSELGTFRHQSRAILRGLRNKESFGRRNGISDQFHLTRAENIMRSNIDKVWIRCLHFVDVCFDVLHFIQVFDRTLLTCSDNEALLARPQGDLCLTQLELDWLGQFDDSCGTWSKLNLDERLDLGFERRRSVGAAASA